MFELREAQSALETLELNEAQVSAAARQSDEELLAARSAMADMRAELETLMTYHDQLQEEQCAFAEAAREIAAAETPASSSSRARAGAWVFRCSRRWVSIA